MYFDFANLLVFLVLAAGFVVVTLLAGRLLFRPKSTGGGAKLETYECGEPTIGQAWIRFDIRFYTIALMFVVFDVEVALLFPWGAVFRDFVVEPEFAERGFGWIAFLEAATFIVILMVGLVYVWVRGDIDWAPRAGERPSTTDRAPVPELTGRVVVREAVAGAGGAPGAGKEDRG